jgi:RNA polymerase II subunit A small phosphatase-like protein
MTEKTNLLILDLDETLIYGSERPLERSPDFIAGPFHVYRRPFLEAFIKSVSEHFRLAVWTSSSSDYAKKIVVNILGNRRLEFLWSRERCTQRLDLETRDYYWLKNLTKVKRKGFDLGRVLVVDDSPEKLTRNYGNHVRVSPFLGDSSDCELPRLAEYLLSLADCTNVRSVEKRGWRGQHT